MKISAGDLRDRITFQKRLEADDGRGNVRGAWADQFSCAAHLVADRGGESIEGGGQIGTQSWTIHVRDWSQTALVTSEWRAINAREPTQIFNLRSNIVLAKYPGFREMKAEEGVVT